MKLIRIFMLSLAIIVFTLTSIGQNKHALLIGGPIDGSHSPLVPEFQNIPGMFNLEWVDFFWTDVFLMHQLLTTKFDYLDGNVKVLFNSSDDYNPPVQLGGIYPWRYQVSENDPPITDGSCTQSEVRQALADLKNTCTPNDFVFIYIFTHGRNPLGTSQVACPYGILCPVEIDPEYLYDDVNDYIFAGEFAQAVSEIPGKKVVWMQPCFSGGFATYFAQQPNFSSSELIVNYSSSSAEEAWQADNNNYCVDYPPDYFFLTYENEEENFYPGWADVCRHGEFSFHLFSSLNGETPRGLDYIECAINIPLSSADIDQNGIVSVSENFNWASTHQSRQHYINGEHYSLQESIVGLSTKTSLIYPNIVSDIGDLDLNTANTGIYGITNSIVVTGNNFLEFGPNSKVYLLNNARIYVQDGATLKVGNGVRIYGNGQNFVRINDGTLDLGLNVRFASIDSSQVFHGLELSKDAISSQIIDATFHRAHLWNDSPGLILDNSNFDHVATSDVDIYGVSSTTGNITILNADFIAASVSIINDDPKYIGQATVQHCTFQDGGISLYGYRNFQIDYNNIESPYEYGIIVSYSGNGSTGNQSISHNNVSNSILGIFLNNTHATVHSNNIHENQRGVYIGNSSTICLSGSPSLTQRIKNCTTEELYIENGCSPYYFKYNQIIDPDNAGGVADPLIRYLNNVANPVTLDVRDNCWGDGFQYDQDLFGYGVTFNYIPTWCPGDPIPEDPPIDMFEDALHQFDSGNYVTAKSIFKTIIDLFPESLQAQASMRELFQVEEFADNDYIALQQYYLSNDSILADSILTKSGEYLATRCNEKFENWPDEIAWFEDKILNPESETDSLFAILDLTHTYLMMENSQTKTAYVGTLSQFKPESIKQFVPFRDTLISLLPGDQKYKQLLQRINNLEEGELLQNVPNPVIDNTDIYYKLNSSGDIVVIITDIFGRKLKTVHENNITTGVHKLNVNLTELKPGIYFYTLIGNGKLFDVKKFTKL